ncbi:MAG: hypothetical protein E7360_02315 [Clostridiales bacterium]|nr:hypothetical protein [Clostridiales bacterium]
MNDFFDENKTQNENLQYNPFENRENVIQNNERLISQNNEYREYEEYKKARSFSRTPLILSLFGLLCSLFVGLGIGFSLPSLILSAIRYTQKPNKTLRWAIVISIVGVTLSLLFIATFIYAVVSGYITQLNFA